MYLQLDQVKYKNYLAHRKEGKESEKLLDHLELTRVYLERISEAKGLTHLIDKLIVKIDETYQELIKRLFYNAIYLHDLGKINPAFQANKMDNPLFQKTTQNSNHSMLGAQEYIQLFKKEIQSIEEDEEYYKMMFILHNFAYQIAKHHGRLTSIETFCKNEEDFDKKYKIEAHFEFYILNKLLFSMLISSDYYATTEYMAELKLERFGTLSQEDIKTLREQYDLHSADFKKNPQGINRIRNEMSEEAERNLDITKYIYYLEAPTGSGKTITSINLALKLLENDPNLNKLFYIFPFNTLVEQTKNVFEEIFGDRLDLSVINSITPIKEQKEDKQENEESQYQKSYISRLFFHSPAIITTHVALFNILFGTSKEDNFPLWQLANSVIILDEIQSYNNHLWRYMVEFFEKYASLLNIKIIIMSATLPKLDYFLEKKSSFVDLIAQEKREYFFGNDYFKNRVKADFTLLDGGKITLDDLFESLKSNAEGKKVLIEFIKKATAREFFDLIKDEFENVYELSGDDNKAYRQFVINQTKEKKPIIVVATQVIEAGVDIDMDIGFKDISTLDSEEQFMGRINRSASKEESIVYFFDIDDARSIYRGDHRLGFDLTQTKYRKILENKDFGAYYQEVLDAIEKQNDKFENGLLTNYEHFEKSVQKLDYQELSKTMTLINSQNFTLYFPFQIDIVQYKGIEEFQDLDDRFMTQGKLDGQKVWDEFKALDTIEGFAKKEYEKSIINSLMQFFTFSIFRFGKQERPPYFTQEYGGYFLVNDLEFVVDGKFDRAKYNARANNNFL